MSASPSRADEAIVHLLSSSPSPSRVTHHARYLPEPPYQHGTPSKTGILLINLGTPEAPTAPAVRRYLREFLSDPRVVEISRPLWWLILNLFILPYPPQAIGASATRRSGPATARRSRCIPSARRQLLRGYLGERIKAPLVVEYAMRYGKPSIADALAGLQATGLRPHPGAAALPAVRGQHHRHRVRCGRRRVRRACATSRHCAASGISTIIRATSPRWRRTSTTTG